MKPGNAALPALLLALSCTQPAGTSGRVLDAGPVDAGDPSDVDSDRDGAAGGDPSPTDGDLADAAATDAADSGADGRWPEPEPYYAPPSAAFGFECVVGDCPRFVDSWQLPGDHGPGLIAVDPIREVVIATAERIALVDLRTRTGWTRVGRHPKYFMLVNGNLIACLQSPSVERRPLEFGVISFDGSTAHLSTQPLCRWVRRLGRTRVAFTTPTGSPEEWFEHSVDLETGEWGTDVFSATGSGFLWGETTVRGGRWVRSYPILVTPDGSIMELSESPGTPGFGGTAPLVPAPWGGVSATFASVWFVDPDGEELSRVELPDGLTVSASPSVGADGTVYVPANRGVVRIRYEDGLTEMDVLAARWMPIQAPTLVDGDHALIAGGLVSFGGAGFAAIDLASGELAWMVRFTHGSVQWAPMLLSGGRILVVDETGAISMWESEYAGLEAGGSPASPTSYGRTNHFPAFELETLLAPSEPPSDEDDR